MQRRYSAIAMDWHRLTSSLIKNNILAAMMRSQYLRGCDMASRCADRAMMR